MTKAERLRKKQDARDCRHMRRCLVGDAGWAERFTCDAVVGHPPDYANLMRRQVHTFKPRGVRIPRSLRRYL